MSNTEVLHEATFDWFHADAKSVILTGTFDNWTSSARLSKIPAGFEVKLQLPWGQKTLYKYIVDGVWQTDPSKPTEIDHEGNANNVYISPAKPTSNGTLGKAKETVVGTAQQFHEGYIAPTIAATTAAVGGLTLGGNTNEPGAATGTASPLVSAAESMPPTAAQATLNQAKSTVLAATAGVQGAISGQTAPASTATAVDLHASETPAAPLLDAASSMPPTTSQKAVNATMAKATELHETHVAPAIAAANARAAELHETHVAPIIAAGNAKAADLHETHVSPVLAKANELHETHVAPAIASIQGSIPEGTGDKIKDAAAAVQQHAATLAQKTNEGVIAPAVAAIPDEHKQKMSETVDKAKSVMPEAAPDIASAPMPSAIAYVASGIGAAIKTVTGIDPINVDKIAVQTPAAETVPTFMSEAPAVGATPAPIAHDEPAVTAQVAPAPSVPDVPPKDTTATPAAAPPVTPSKKAFPSTESAPSSPEKGSVSAASTSSKSGSTRKKRDSIFGKLKNVFHSDKDKDKAKKSSA